MSTQREINQKRKELQKQATLLRASAATIRKRRPNEAVRKEIEAGKIEKQLEAMT